MGDFIIDFENITMGGYNSGGGRGAMRQVHFWDLKISTLKRFGMLKPGSYQSLIWSVRDEERACIGVQAFADHLILIYKSRERGGDWQDIRDRTPLTFTTPNYGGQRAWFVCPSCGQRKGVLWGRTYYRCAKCHGMTYESQYEDRASRMLDRAHAIKIKLGGRAGCQHPFPPRPKGMH